LDKELVRPIQGGRAKHFEGRVTLARDGGFGFLQQEWVEYLETNYGLDVSLLVVNCVGSFLELVFTPAVCVPEDFSLFSPVPTMLQRY
jgi:hypothetical protein